MPRPNTRPDSQTSRLPTLAIIAAIGVAAVGAGIWLSLDRDVGDHDTAATTAPLPEPSAPAMAPQPIDAGTPVASTATMSAPERTAEQTSAPELAMDDLHAIASMFHLDPYGQLQIDDKLIAAFEVLRAEFEPFAAERPQYAQETLLRALPGTAGERAAALFATYQAYRQELDRLMAEAMSMQATAETPARLFERMHALRRQHFDADTADALFGHEEAQTRYTLEAMRIEQDRSLTPEQRRDRLEALRRQLPSDAPPLEVEGARVDDLAAEVAAMRARGASEADVQYLREQRLGIEATHELAKMETLHAEWERRYQLYRQERSLIDASALSPQDKEAQIAELRRKHFAEQEIAAVQAYDRENAR